MFESGTRVRAAVAEDVPLPWSGVVPDGMTAMVLDQTGPPADTFEQLERIGAWEKIIAWAQARQYQEIARLVAAAQAAPAPGLTPGQAVESAQAEVGLMLRLSPAGTAWRVCESRQLVEDFPATFAALHAGAITLAKARIIAEGCTDLEPAAAAAVQRKVLPRAPQQTTGQLRAALRRAVLRADSEAAKRRRERKRRERGVVLYPERDGMATLSATLPAAEAVGAYAVLDQHARACGSGDQRPMPARRADALVDLVLRETGFCSTPASSPPPSPPPPSRPAPATNPANSPATAPSPPNKPANSPPTPTAPGAAWSPTPSAARCSTTAPPATAHPHT